MSSYYSARQENRQFNHKIIMLKQHEIIKLATKQVKHATFMIHMLPFTPAQHWFEWPVPAALPAQEERALLSFGVCLLHCTPSGKNNAHEYFNCLANCTHRLQGTRNGIVV